MEKGGVKDRKVSDRRVNGRGVNVRGIVSTSNEGEEEVEKS